MTLCFKNKSQLFYALEKQPSNIKEKQRYFQTKTKMALSQKISPKRKNKIYLQIK